MEHGGRDTLIQELIEGGHLRTRCVIEAFRAIGRRDFVAKGYENEAYENYPLPIGYGQTISQPLTVAFMLELLQSDAGQRVLDIGAGSGWQTAILAHVVSGGGVKEKKGKVIAIERIPQLAKVAQRNVGKYSFIGKGTASVLCADGSKGYPEEAPYDRIIAAASGRGIPQTWKEQLAIGGRIVAPVENKFFHVCGIPQIGRA